jgi:D-arabinose 1-dehydrogenase-like Zn-dependent alcohol dehydrogenase
MPIIFITGQGDVPTTVRAMKAGAVEFLTKPFSDEVLLSAIRPALERSRVALGRELEMQALRGCYESLTDREGQVPGDLVAVQGIGGHGHLGIQFASKFGLKVAAIGRGSENAVLANKLGAFAYIDSKATNAAEELQKLGGAKVILATAPNSKAMSELINGLGPNVKLIVAGAAFDSIEVTPIQLIGGSKSIQGWAAGTPADSEDTLKFAELSGVRPMIETFPLEKAAEAYARMISGDAQFRVVLRM